MTTKRTRFYVESTDPLFETETFDSYKDAVTYSYQIADELKADGFVIEFGLASRRNMHAFRATKNESNPIDVQVNDEE